TKNGGALLQQSMAALAAQSCDSPFEILVIDSGSIDGTVEFLRAQPFVTLLSIAPEEFQHGRTRNLAMRKTQGELVAFLTQDAIPDGPNWLASWIAFMDTHAEVAGAFGQQVPHIGADPLEALEVTNHFRTLAGLPLVFRAPAQGATAGERLLAHYFSNVNSC